MIYHIKQNFLSYGNKLTIFDEFNEPIFYFDRQLTTSGYQLNLKSEAGKMIASFERDWQMLEAEEDDLWFESKLKIFQATYNILINEACYATFTVDYNHRESEKFFCLNVPGLKNGYAIEGSDQFSDVVFRRAGREVAIMSRNGIFPVHYYVSIAKDEDVILILATCILIDRIRKDKG